MFSAKPLQADVENFVGQLLGRGWVHARALTAELNVTRRHLRALAEHSEGRVLSGNEGYRLTAEATFDEKEKFARRMLSQVRRTQARVTATLRVWAETQNPSTPF